MPESTTPRPPTSTVQTPSPTPCPTVPPQTPERLLSSSVRSTTHQCLIDDTQTLTEDAAHRIVVTNDDTDADGGSLTITAISYSGTGNATINGSATIDYTPAANFSGSETITTCHLVFRHRYRDTDHHSDRGQRRACRDQRVLTEDDSLTSITVLDDNTDADGDTLTVSAISYSGTGTAAINSDNARIVTTHQPPTSTAPTPSPTPCPTEPSQTPGHSPSPNRGQRCANGS